jgi:hypothetical protein
MNKSGGRKPHPSPYKYEKPGNNDPVNTRLLTDVNVCKCLPTINGSSMKTKMRADPETFLAERPYLMLCKQPTGIGIILFV